MHSTVRRRLRGVLPCVAAGFMAFGVVACGSDSNNDSGSSGSSTSADTGAAAAPAGGDAATAVTEAKKVLDVGYKGRFTAPPTASVPAAKGKNVWILMSFGGSPSVSIPAKTAAEAGKALGWKTTIYDAKGDPGNYVKGMSQAIANGANGIVLIAIDCSYVKNQLKAAKAKGIAISEVYAFDCWETNPGDEHLFTANISFGKRYGEGLTGLWKHWGGDSAAWVVANTGGKAVPLVLHTDQIAVLVAYQDGFEEQMAKCKTCKVVNQPWNTVTELTPAAISNLMKNAVLKNPDVNSSVFGSTVTSGYNQAILSLGAKGKSMKIIAGLGLPDEFALIRKGQGSGLNATTAWPQEWIAYAAMDSINSYLNKKPLEDEGVGFQIVDNTNKEAWPAPGKLWQGDDNFRDDYKKRWGVGGAA